MPRYQLPIYLSVADLQKKLESPLLLQETIAATKNISMGQAYHKLINDLGEMSKPPVKTTDTIEKVKKKY